MVSLFLVEDEIAMREGIKKRIDWTAEGIDFVGEASDGELAFPLILEKKPDILLTDIKMPFVDGLELSEMVKKELPDTRIIILSGYDEFEYARRAISLGVTEYILKPIAPAALLEKIKEVQEKIEEERKHQAHFRKEGAAETLEQNRLKFFSSLVMNKKTMPELISEGKELHINLTGRCFAIVLFSVMVKGEGISGYSAVRNTFKQQLDETVCEYENWYVFDREEEGYALLGVGNDMDAFSEEIPEVLEDIVSLAEDVENATYFFGVSSVTDRLSHIQAAYIEANQAFSKRFFLPANQLVYASETKETQPGEATGSLDISAAITNETAGKTVDVFLKTGSFDEIAPFVDNIFESIGEQNAKSMLFLSYALMDMYMAAAKFVNTLGYDAKSISSQPDDISEMLKGYDIDLKAKDFLKEVLTEAIRLRDNSAEKKHGSVLHRAVEYIDAHYSDEDISLNVVAAEVNISPNHLSSIFSKEYGTTFIEYLINKRIEAAKTLLMTTNKRSSEIAYEVGYKDPHYFSYTFKKVAKMTTKEFRARGEKANQ